MSIVLQHLVFGNQASPRCQSLLQSPKLIITDKLKSLLDATSQLYYAILTVRSLTQNYFRNYCALFALAFRGQRGKKNPNHFQKTCFHPSFLKQHDLVDPISSIQFCLNHPELHSENTPRKILFIHHIESLLFSLLQAFVIICPPNGGNKKNSSPCHIAT